VSAAVSDHLATLRADAPHASFPTPWAARAFALAVAASEAKLFALAEFQAGLIESIRRYESAGRCIDAEEAYYGCWVEALVELLGRKELVALRRIVAAEHRIRQRMASPAHDHSDDNDDLHERTAPSPIFVERGR
jgi:nitrile hydratase accessory protein